MALLGVFVAACALADTNEVFHWGDEDSRPINPRDLTQVVGVSAGHRWFRSLALRADGTVVNIPYGEWAYDTFLTPLSNIVALAVGGQLALRADGTVVDVDTATLVWPHLTNAVAAASGGAHHLALRTDGSVFAWGDNNYGQTNLPPGLSNVVAIAAGGAHCLAVRADGTVVGWGRNNAGQASPPAGLSNVIAVAAGRFHSLALRRDGTVVAWGTNRFDLNTVPAGVSNVVAIAAISSYSMTLRADGTLVAWGDPLRSATRLYPPERFTNLLAVAAGVDHAVALRDGPADAAPPLFTDSPWLIGTLGYPVHHRLVAKYRPTSFSSPDLPEGLELDSASGVIRGSPQVAGTHRFHVTAANAAGSTTREYTLFVNLPLPAIQNGGLMRVPLGSAFRLQILAHPAGDWYGADGLPPGLALDPATGVISGVSAAEGLYPVSVVASNRYGLGWGTFTLRVNAIIGWGSNDKGQLDAPFGPGEVTALASGPAHALALRADGSLLGWGAGAPIPARASNVVAVAAGYDHSVALRADGSLVSWGALPTGPYWRKDAVAVGAGEASTVILARDGALVSPAVPPGLSNVLAFSVYGVHGLALRANGAVAEWGLPGGEPPPPDLTNVTALAAGVYLSLALRADGTVVAWGDPNQPGTRVPAGLSNVVAIAAGRAHALALRADGTVVAWGENNRGQTAVPAGLTHVALIAAAGDHSLALVRPRDDFAPPRFHPPASLVATLDHPFQFRLPVMGDVSGYGADGSPAGLSLDPASGLLQGVPRANGQFPVVFTVTNANGVTRREVTLWVNRALPAIQSHERVYALVGQPFTYAVQADYAPTWYGAFNLPPGCRLDVRTGLISGTPTRAGTYLVGLVAQNAYGWGLASLPVQVGNLVHWDARGLTVLGPGSGHAVALTPPVWLISTYSYSYQPLALMDDGQVFAIYKSGAAYPIPGLTNVAALATGSAGQTLALLDDGRMQAWGAGSSVDRGLDRVPSGVSNVVAIAAGGLHNLALRADGTVFGWGRFKPIPAGLRPVIAIGAGESGDSLAVLADGTAVYWDGDPPELRATGLSNVVAVAGGWVAGFALLEDGTLYELRYGNATPTGLSRVVTMAATPGQVLALLENGTLAYHGPAGADNPAVRVWIKNVSAIGIGQYAWVSDLPVLFRDGLVRPGATVRLVAPLLPGQPAFVQWYRNGVPLPGATRPALVLSNLQPAQLGAYTALTRLPFAVRTNAAITLAFVPGLHGTVEPTELVAVAGQEIEHRWRVVNAGPDTAAAVTLSGHVDSAFEVLDITANPGDARGTAGSFAAQLGELHAGAEAEVRVRLRALTAGAGELRSRLESANLAGVEMRLPFEVLEAVPALAVEMTETGPALTWPLRTSGFALEVTWDLAPPIRWERVVDLPGLAGDRFRYRLPTHEPRTFYRLAR